MHFLYFCNCNFIYCILIVWINVLNWVQHRWVSVSTSDDGQMPLQNIFSHDGFSLHTKLENYYYHHFQVKITNVFPHRAYIFTAWMMQFVWLVGLWHLKAISHYNELTKRTWTITKSGKVRIRKTSANKITGLDGMNWQRFQTHHLTANG